MSETIFDSKDYASLFNWTEYCIFAAVVSASMGIGVFYGFFNKKNTTNEDFLVGGRTMSVFPVAMSLVCSFISGVALLGDPIEVYYYGIRYIFFVVSIIPMTFSVAYLYVPVFCGLKLTSAYQYLEVRFNRSVRLIASIMAVIHLTLYMPVTVFAPSLALDQVAGINKYISSAIIFLTCVAYSSIGGLKAILWTDVLQGLVMFGSVITILFLGVSEVGGFKEVWERAADGQRTELWNFDPDPRTRYTFWTGCVGAYFTWLSLFAGSQGQIQRYLSVPSIKKAQKCLTLSLVGLILVQAPSFFLGLVIYAKYYKCDPVSVEAVGSSDQLLPLFVMDTLGNITGLPGLLVAGLTCGSLSSVSSALNAIPAIIVEDYVKAYYPHLSDTKLGYLSKLISVIAGLVSFSLIFVIAAIGSIVPFAAILHGTFLGPTVGLFTLGFFFPWSNSIGSVLGAALSIVLTLFLGIGSTLSGINGNLPDQKLPLSTEACYLNTTEEREFVWAGNMHFTTTNEGNVSWKDEEWSVIINLFSVSYIWHPVVAVVGTVIFGLIFSVVVNMVTKPNRPINAKYMSPPIVQMWKKILSDDLFHYWIEVEEKFDCRKSTKGNL